MTANETKEIIEFSKRIQPWVELLIKEGHQFNKDTVKLAVERMKKVQTKWFEHCFENSPEWRLAREKIAKEIYYSVREGK